MAALGLSRWLTRSKKRNASRAPAHEERRLKSWSYRPVLEQMEDRIAVGCLLVRPIVPDGCWLGDGLDSALAEAAADLSQALSDTSIFDAVDDVFASAPASEGGGGAGLPDGVAAPGGATA